MERDRARSLAVAVLAVLALALAAAILSGAVETGPLQDFGLGNAPESDAPGGGGGSGFFPGGGSARGAFGLFCITHPLFVYGIPLFALGVAALLVHRFGYWAGSRLSAAFGLLLGIPYALLTSCEAANGGLEAPAAVGDAWAQAGAVVPSAATNPLVLVGLILGGVILVVLIVRYLGRRFGSDGSGAAFHVALAPRPANPTSDLAGVADAAAEAADRIDDAAAVDNEVYRAWREMTEHLEVERPAASTPGEFAEAAIAEGLDPARVEALTDVFERVRYGDADPAEYATEAVEALRGIEAAAEEESGG